MYINKPEVPPQNYQFSSDQHRLFWKVIQFRRWKFLINKAKMNKWFIIDLPGLIKAKSLAFNLLINKISLLDFISCRYFWQQRLIIWRTLMLPVSFNCKLSITQGPPQLHINWGIYSFQWRTQRRVSAGEDGIIRYKLLSASSSWIGLAAIFL